MNELDLFAAALAITDPADRAALLDRECADQPALRERLSQLLDAHARSNPLLDRPAAGEPETTGTYHNPAEVTGTIIADKYKLLQQIGDGGMGTVWMADQTEPIKRRVAVKLIRVERSSSSTILARFEAERQAIALMDHPNIAKLLDAGATELGSPFFVMELVKGIPLNDYCDTHKLSIPERLKLFTQICSAVQHAHQKGIIHRDLKPTNILVESHDGKPVPKVIDFGLAKATSGLQLTENTLFTGFGTVMGTPTYMAPEQANFNAVDVDTRADVYALGVILYELLTGTTPLTRESMKKAALDEMLKLIREQEAPTPSSRLSSTDSKPTVAANRQSEPQKLGRFVKGELDWIVLKALSKERERRYETANGFAKDIERFLNHEPVTAGPVTAVYRVRKFVRRNRGQVIAASLVMVALLAGIAGTTIGLIRANRAVEAERMAQEEAQRQAQKAMLASEEERKARLAAQTNEKLAGDRLAQVEAEKKKAEEEKQISKAVKDFLQTKLLSQASTGAQAQTMLKIGGTASEATLNPTVRELLDRAAKELARDKIEQSFPRQPLVQAEILATVGATYSSIGEFPPAIDFLKRAESLRRQHLGPEHAKTLQSMSFLGSAYYTAGKWDLALPLFEEILKLDKATYGPEDPNTLSAMSNLALAYLSAGKYELVLPLLEESLKVAKAKHGPDHANTLSTMINLCMAYQATGKLNLALPLCEETLKLTKAKFGPEYPDTLVSMSNLASTYLRTGKKDLALPIFEETLTLSKTKLGPEHPFTLGAMSNLGVAYDEVGKHDLALPLLQEALKLRKAKLGPDHADTIKSMACLAAVYDSFLQHDKSIALSEEALKLQEKKLERNHPETLWYFGNLGASYLKVGRLKEAIPLLEEAYEGSKKFASLRWVSTRLSSAYVKAGEIEKLNALLADVRKSLPKDSTELAELFAQTGRQLVDQKRSAEAEPLLRESLAIREKTQPEVWTTFNSLSLLGKALLDQKKYADAETLLLKGYEGMKACEKTIPPQGTIRITDALDRLIELYTATNKPDEAKKWQDVKAKLPKPAEKKP